MRVFSIIFGILMTIFGITCMVTPLYTAFELNIFFVMLVAVYGMIGFIGGIASKTYGVGFVFSILSMIFGIALLCFPMLIAVTDAIIIYMAACWLILQGVISVVTSLKVRKATSSKLWILHLIIGILGIIVGIYSFIHPLIFALSVAWALGILVGFYFIQTGITMLFFSPKSE